MDKGKDKINFALEQAMEAQRGRRRIAVFFSNLGLI
jgi:hypothetical protein